MVCGLHRAAASKANAFVTHFPGSVYRSIYTYSIPGTCQHRIALLPLKITVYLQHTKDIHEYPSPPEFGIRGNMLCALPGVSYRTPRVDGPVFHEDGGSCATGNAQARPPHPRLQLILLVQVS